jgi:hypothetical protein
VDEVDGKEPVMRRFTAIVQRGRIEAYAKLVVDRHELGLDRIIRDRRLAQRRLNLSAPMEERRRRERRRQPPKTWDLMGFLVVLTSQGEVGQAVTPRHAAIVRRGETATFERLAKTMDRVIWDRRVTERRTGMLAPRDGTEQRREERRRPAPGTWTTKGWVVALIA